MPANLKSLYRRQLTRPGYKEGIRQSLYDFMVYDNAGHAQIKFFSVPNGGTYSSGGVQYVKSLADTNLELSGQIPQGQKYIVESIELIVEPGSSAANYVRQDPFLARAAQTAPQFANDIWMFYAGLAFLQLIVGTRPYLTEAPLGRFPPKTGLALAPAAEALQAVAANLVVSADYARFAGRPYMLNPVLPIKANTNFNVTLNWPTVTATPSGFDARVGVVLDGVLFRD